MHAGVHAGARAHSDIEKQQKLETNLIRCSLGDLSVICGLFEIFSSILSIVSDLLDAKSCRVSTLWGKLLSLGVSGPGKQPPHPSEGLCPLLKGIRWAVSSLLVLLLVWEEAFQEIRAYTV